MTVRTPAPAVQVPIEVGIRRLERRVRLMERRYEMPSEEALAAVRAGTMRETLEVCNWLIFYRVLQDLRAAAGRATGSDTTTTESSTNGTSTSSSPKV
jgi:hypothetical protein